jgi:hypothetical protein
VTAQHPASAVAKSFVAPPACPFGGESENSVAVRIGHEPGVLGSPSGHDALTHDHICLEVVDATGHDDDVFGAGEID